MTPAGSKIVEAYRLRTPTSARLAERARDIFPSGVTHDGRYLKPHPIYVERASGSRKWDVDGNEYVDYAGGHGALLLGHNHPPVIEAVREQLQRGTHYGSCHELEIEWGDWVKRLIPSAQQVRFTSSGTEATLLGIRLARAHTGRTKLLRFASHFHGWHDQVSFGVNSHFDGTTPPGVLPELAKHTVVAPPGDKDAAQRILSQDDDIAAVILEPTGASWGQVPIAPDFLHALREMTAQHGAILIFDEVISGFRVSPGGAQAHYGVTPDLTTLAKILGGGFPAGAIVGSKEIMEHLAFPDATQPEREKISHHGTFNANPVSAAAGIATLKIVAETDACRRANDYARRLREALGEVVRDEGVNWIVYGTFSGFHIYTNPAGESTSVEDIESGVIDYRQLKARLRPDLLTKLALGMLAHGVEIFGWPGGVTSAVHSDDDLEQTVDAFRRTLRMLAEEGELGP